MVLWQGRYRKTIKDEVLKFTTSLDLDKCLYKYDILGSLYHAQILTHSKILTQTEYKKIKAALQKIRKDIENNKFKFASNDEDIHTAIERALVREIGVIGKRIHTARSRNDQILMAVKLYLKDFCSEYIKALKQLQQDIISLSEKYIDSLFCGFTHLQPAQPVLFSHYMMSFFFVFERDIQRMINTCNIHNTAPLGSAALAGTSIKYDRKKLASIAGFDSPTFNSMETVSSRDFISDVIYNISICAVNASRISEDFIIYASPGFGFIDIDESYCTGSSIMPQKKNPDVLELIRGRSSRMITNLTGILTLLKGLPTTYNRDLQEDKVYLFSSTTMILDIIRILGKLLKNIKLKKNNINKALEIGFMTATDIAEYLVKKNMPFREAHSIAGNIVRYCEDNEKKLDDLTYDELKKFSSKISKDIFDALNIKISINLKNNFGSTSLKSVKEQIKIAKKLLKKK